MLSLLRSKKGQLFVLSSISIILLLAGLVRIFSFYNIPYFSEIVLKNEFFIFKNIVDKSIKLVDVSKDCEELSFNLEEFQYFILETFAGYNILFNYTVNRCDASYVNITFQIVLRSETIYLETKFDKIKNW